MKFRGVDTIRQRKTTPLLFVNASLCQSILMFQKNAAAEVRLPLSPDLPTEAQKTLQTVPDKTDWERKKMDSRGIEPRTTPRIGFEALCASEMLREYYTTKPRARDVVELLLL